MDMGQGVQLSVKIGIGVGAVSVLYIGGIFGRMESVAVGAPLIQAFESEHHGVSGQVIVSPECWAYLKKYYEGLEINKGTNNAEDKGPGMEDMGEGFMLIHQNGWETMAAFLENKKMIKKLAFKNDIEDDPILIQAIKFYVPGGVTAHIDETNDEEKWYNEERNVATLFVNLGLENAILLEAAEKNSAMKVVNEVLASVQKAVYQYEGSNNKFLMDDKGSTLIACFGLTPNAHFCLFVFSPKIRRNCCSVQYFFGNANFFGEFPSSRQKNM